MSYQADRRHLQGGKQQQHPHAVNSFTLKINGRKANKTLWQKKSFNCFSTNKKQPLSKRVKSDMRYIPRTELHHLRNLYRSNSRDQLFILAPSLFTTPTPTPGLHLTNWDAGAEPRPSSPWDWGDDAGSYLQNPRSRVGGGGRWGVEGAWPSMNVVIHKNKELLHSERVLALGCLFIFVRAKIIFVMLLSFFSSHAYFCFRPLLCEK